MKSVIVCVSLSHGNTRKVPEAMASVIGAEVVEPEQLSAADVAGYDLVGIGSVAAPASGWGDQSRPAG